MHNFIADVRKGGDLLKSFEQSHLVNNMRFFYVRIVKGPKTNIFTCKLCAWVIFIILFTRLLCDNSNSLTYEPRKGGKSNTFSCRLCDRTSHADWLFTVIIVSAYHLYRNFGEKFPSNGTDIFFLAPKTRTGLSCLFTEYWQTIHFPSTWSLALVIQTNGTENFGRFGKNGKKVVPRKVLLFLRKSSTEMNRSN